MSLEQSLIDFCQLKLDKASAQEKEIIDGVLFMQLFEAIRQKIRDANKPILRIIKTDRQQEAALHETSIVQFIIKDILRSGEYSLSGLAYYTNVPEETLHNLLSGQHNSPSLSLSRRLFDLHRLVKPELYRVLFKEILAESPLAA